MRDIDRLNDLYSQIPLERDSEKLKVLGREINELLKRNPKVVFEPTAAKHQHPKNWQRSGSP
jgi:hypothetical protein